MLYCEPGVLYFVTNDVISKFFLLVRFQMDNWNKLRNICSREIGAKMKRKEAVGDDDTVPQGVVEKLDSLTVELIRVSGWVDSSGVIVGGSK